MIFTEEDMKAGEQMARDMLDCIHHKGAYANLDEYVRLKDELNDA